MPEETTTEAEVVADATPTDAEAPSTDATETPDAEVTEVAEPAPVAPEADTEAQGVVVIDGVAVIPQGDGRTPIAAPVVVVAKKKGDFVGYGFDTLSDETGNYEVGADGCVSKVLK